MVFRISLFVVVALALVAGLAPQSFEAVSKALLAAVIQNAGWLYLLIVFLTLVFLYTLLSERPDGCGSAVSTPNPSFPLPLGWPCCLPPAWALVWCSGAPLSRSRT